MVTKHWKVFSTIIGQQQEKILDSTYSRMSNIFTLVTAFNRFCFETLSFVPLFSYYLFAMQRCGVHGPTISPSAAHPISRYAKIIENSFPQFINWIMCFQTLTQTVFKLKLCWIRMIKPAELKINNRIFPLLFFIWLKFLVFIMPWTSFLKLKSQESLSLHVTICNQVVQKWLITTSCHQEQYHSLFRLLQFSYDSLSLLE